MIYQCQQAKWVCCWIRNLPFATLLYEILWIIHLYFNFILVIYIKATIYIEHRFATHRDSRLIFSRCSSKLYRDSFFHWSILLWNKLVASKTHSIDFEHTSFCQFLYSLSLVWSRQHYCGLINCLRHIIINNCLLE